MNQIPLNQPQLVEIGSPHGKQVIGILEFDNLDHLV